MRSDFRLELKRLLRAKRILLLAGLALLAAGFFFMEARRESGVSQNSIAVEFAPYLETLYAEQTRFREIFLKAGGTQAELSQRLAGNEALVAMLSDIVSASESAEGRSRLPQQILSMTDRYEAYRADPSLRIPDPAQEGGLLWSDALSLSQAEIHTYRDYFIRLSEPGLSHEPDSGSLLGPFFALQTVLRTAGLTPMLVLPVFFLFLWGDDTENLGKRFRGVQPAKPWTGWLAKVLAACAGVMFFYLALLFFAWLMAGFFGDGFGTWTHPVRIGPFTDRSQQQIVYAVRPVSTHALQLGLLLGGAFFFLFSLFGLVALLCKHRIASFSVFAVLVLFPARFFQVHPWELGDLAGFPFWNPYAGLSVQSALSDPRVSVLLPAAVLILSGLGLMALSTLLEKRETVQRLFAARSGREAEKMLLRYEKRRGRLPVALLEAKKLALQPAARVVLLLCAVLPLVFYWQSTLEYDRLRLADPICGVGNPRAGSICPGIAAKERITGYAGTFGPHRTDPAGSHRVSHAGFRRHNRRAPAADQ